MYIGVDEIITISALLTALLAIFGVIFAVYKWYLKQNCQDLRIEAMEEENYMIMKALLACLDGLNQIGANGNVSKQKGELEEYLNKKAHEPKNTIC